MESKYFRNVENIKYNRKYDGHIEYGTAGFRTKYECFFITLTLIDFIVRNTNIDETFS